MGGKQLDFGDWPVVVAVVVVVAVAAVGAATVSAELTQGQQQGEQHDRQQPTVRFVYPAKFACGSLGEAQAADPDDGAIERYEQEPPVKPGNYATSINIHNFREEEVNVTINVTPDIALPRDVSASQASVVTTTLGPHEGLELECNDIGNQLSASGASYVEGTVVIEMPRRLEVEGIYTAQRVIVLDETSFPLDPDPGAGDGDGVGAAQIDNSSVSIGTSIDVEDIEPYRVKVTPDENEPGAPDDSGP